MHYYFRGTPRFFFRNQFKEKCCSTIAQSQRFEAGLQIGFRNKPTVVSPLQFYFKRKQIWPLVFPFSFSLFNKDYFYIKEIFKTSIDCVEAYLENSSWAQVFIFFIFLTILFLLSGWRRAKIKSSRAFRPLKKKKNKSL